MQLRALTNVSLPKLAWVAEVDRTSGLVTLLHGPLVEVRATFWIEGVWDGPFQHGGFGDTDCVFGTGGILGEASVRFVTSASTTDYLYYAEEGGHVTVSNSLPLLLATIEDALDPRCLDYPRICDSILEGIHDYRRDMPTNRGTVRRQTYRNLDVSMGTISESDKAMPPRFPCFDEYRNYLRDNYARIAANARDGARTQPLEICSTQSKGYDSTAINAMASAYGIDQVFTVPKGKSTRHVAPHDDGALPDDDGSEICAALGLPCTRLNRQAFTENFDDEALYYCALHHNQDANLADIRKHIGTASLLLTGINGDVVWSRETQAMRTGLDSAIRRGDTGGHGLSELRLVVGFIHLPVPFMGARRKPDIVRITESAEMAPWRVGHAYDRPIPRRIAEDAGVPRHLFGQSKMASVVIFSGPAIPYGTALRREFCDYLVDEQIMARSRAWLWPVVLWVNAMLFLRSETRFAAVYYAERVVSKLIGRSFRFPRLWSKLDGALFCFCVNRTAETYFEHLSRLKKPPASLPKRAPHKRHLPA